VQRPSTIELYGSEMISVETIGSSVYLMIPTRSPDSVAALRAALTSATVQVFLTLTVTSTMEPVTVGTRMERPSMDFGGRAWTTFGRAIAAPVEVGIMLIAAERARRRSL